MKNKPSKIDQHQKVDKNKFGDIHPAVLELWGFVPYPKDAKSDKELLFEALAEKYLSSNEK